MGAKTLLNERKFASVPTLDTERKAIFNQSKFWTPSNIVIFGHSINIDIPTGNILISTSDVSYPYFNFFLGINRRYDAQKQHMKLSSLRNYPNIYQKPHWFGNWHFDFEADVDEVWLTSYPELHITSGVGANGLFEIYKPNFKRNFKSQNSAVRVLQMYGIPGRTLADLDWEFKENDFVLRTKRKAFQILTGRFYGESLVDNIHAQLWLFNPVSGSGFKITSDFLYNIPKLYTRDVGFPLVVSKLVDALGHSIELKASGELPYQTYLLSDFSNRKFRLEMGGELTSIDGLNPSGVVRNLLVSKAVDETKRDYNEYNYSYEDKILLKNVKFPSINGDRHITYHYDDKKQFPGILVGIENSFGDQITFEYEEDPADNDERMNPRLKIKKIIDPEGIEFKYDYEKRKSKVLVTISQNGVVDRQINYTFIQDTLNTKQRFITETKIEVARGYYIDADGQIQTRDNKHSQTVRNLTKYTDDGRYNIEKEINPLNREIVYKYNDFNQIKQEWDYGNHWTKYKYDNPTDYNSPIDPSPNAPFRYDLLNKIKQNVKRITDHSLSSQFRKEEIEISIFYEWDKFNADSSTDENDIKQSTHRLSKIKDERDKIWILRYDDSANHNPLRPTSIESPLSYFTKFTYNNRGEPLTIEDAQCNIHQYRYNEQGQLEEYIDPNNESIKIEYYSCGKGLHKCEDQMSKATLFKRDVEGRIKQIIDPLQDTQNFRYHTNGRLKKVIKHRPKVHKNPSDQTSPSIITEYPNLEYEISYTPLGKMQSLKNPKGLMLVFEYDEAGRRYQWYHLTAEPKYTKFLFNPAGQIIRRVDRKNRSTIYEYHNHSGFLKSIQLPSWNNGSNYVAGKFVNYRLYDYLGRVFSIEDNETAGTKEFIYDDAGNLIFRHDPGGFELSFEYDDDNRLWRIRQTNGLIEQTFELDGLGRQYKIIDSDEIDGALTWIYIYEKGVGSDRKVLNLFKMKQLEIGLFTNFDYDEKNRLKKIESEWAGAQGGIYSQQIDYRYDDLIKNISGNDPNSYRYDGIKQLIFEETENLSSDYDKAGNRKYREDISIIPLPIENVYSELNRLKKDNSISSTFTYDANGNLSDENSSTKSFYFDGSDQLRRIIQADDYQIDYIYDEQGKLVKRIEKDLRTDDVQNTEFRYLDNKPIIVNRNGKLLMLLTWDTNGKLLRIRKPEPVSGDRKMKTLLPIYNCLGDIIRLYGSDKNVLTKLKYDAWGNFEKPVEFDNQLEFLGYRGGVWDNKSKLLLLGARWYYPKIGRWLSEDPLLSTNFLDKHSLKQYYNDLGNCYSYSINNPVVFKDTEGYSVLDTVFDIIATGIDIKVLPTAGKIRAFGSEEESDIIKLLNYYRLGWIAKGAMLKISGFVAKHEGAKLIGGNIMKQLGMRSPVGFLLQMDLLSFSLAIETIEAVQKGEITPYECAEDYWLNLYGEYSDKKYEEEH